MKFNPNDAVLVNGVPAHVISHDVYTMPDGSEISSVHVQMFNPSRGWVEFHADASIVKPDPHSTNNVACAKN